MKSFFFVDVSDSLRNRSKCTFWQFFSQICFWYTFTYFWVVAVSISLVTCFFFGGRDTCQCKRFILKSLVAKKKNWHHFKMLSQKTLPLKIICQNIYFEGQRGNQYLRKCTSPNWDFAQCGNITVHVDFSPPFSSVPYVMLGVSKIDAGKDHNTRFQAYASAITRQGFDYTINTWGDSVLWGSTFEWLACPY